MDIDKLKEFITEAFVHWEEKHLRQFEKKSPIYPRTMLDSLYSSVIFYIAKHIDELK